MLSCLGRRLSLFCLWCINWRSPENRYASGKSHYQVASIKKLTSLALVLCLAAAPLAWGHGAMFFGSNVVAVAGDCTSGSDTFTRANENPLANGWTEHDLSYSLVSNAATPLVAGNWNSAWCNATASADQFSQDTPSADADSGAGVRISLSGDSVSGYGCTANGGTYTLYRIQDRNNQSSIGSYSGSGTVKKATAVGTTIKCFLDGVERISVTDATYATGKPGILVYGTGATLTNWTGGTYP